MHCLYGAILAEIARRQKTALAGHPLQPVGGVVEVEGRSQLLFLIFIIWLLQILAACRLLVMVRRFSCLARKTRFTDQRWTRPPALEGGLPTPGPPGKSQKLALESEGLPIPTASQ